MLGSDEETIGTVEAAEILGVNRSTVARWVQAEKLEPVLTLPGYRGDHRFNRRDVEKMAQAS